MIPKNLTIGQDVTHARKNTHIHTHMEQTYDCKISAGAPGVQEG